MAKVPNDFGIRFYGEYSKDTPTPVTDPTDEAEAGLSPDGSLEVLQRERRKMNRRKKLRLAASEGIILKDDASTDAEIEEAVKLATAAKAPHVTLTSVADMVAAPVEWLVPHWVALGAINLLAGNSGTGKSSIAFNLAATVSAGGMLPDGSYTDALGDVLIWSGEDSASNTIVPRLLAAGADSRRIKIIGVEHDFGRLRDFNPATDMPLLAEAAATLPNLKLLIIDPIISAVARDSNQASQVREGLAPVRDFAERFKVAVLGVHHFRKGGKDSDKGSPLDRVLGSQGFGALARIVLATATGKSGRALVRVKSNLGPDGDAFVYELASASVPGYPGLPPAQTVEWHHVLEGRPGDLMARFEKDGNKRSTAAAWLSRQLRAAGEPVLRSELVELAEAELGISDRTLERARAEIGAVGIGEHKTRKWFLPSRLKAEIDFPA